MWTSMDDGMMTSGSSQRIIGSWL